MQLVKQETHHNTPEQVMQYISAALEVVDAMEPPDDLRAAVFTAAVNLCASKSIAVGPVEQHGLTIPNLAVKV